MSMQSVFKKHSKIQKHLSSGKSALCTANDIRLFIASILYRGVIQKPVARMFYSKNKLFETLGFKKDIASRSISALRKIHSFCRYFITVLRKLSRSMNVLLDAGSHFLHLKTISDEALLLWKGRLCWKQFIRTTRERFGTKSFVLAQASSGHIWKLGRKPLPTTSIMVACVCSGRIREMYTC